MHTITPSVLDNSSDKGLTQKNIYLKCADKNKWSILISAILHIWNEFILKESINLKHKLSFSESATSDIHKHVFKRFKKFL